MVSLFARCPSFKVPSIEALAQVGKDRRRFLKRGGARRAIRILALDRFGASRAVFSADGVTG